MHRFGSQHNDLGLRNGSTLNTKDKEVCRRLIGAILPLIITLLSGIRAITEKLPANKLTLLAVRREAIWIALRQCHITRRSLLARTKLVETREVIRRHRKLSRCKSRD